MQFSGQEHHSSPGWQSTVQGQQTQSAVFEQDFSLSEFVANTIAQVNRIVVANANIVFFISWYF